MTDRPATRNGRHHRLLEACARPGCPVCGCLRDSAARHLTAVLAEHVTDPVSRARLAAAWGFCAAHATALSEMPDAALGTAIVYHALVEQASRWLDETATAATTPVRRRGWRALVGRSRPPGNGTRSRHAGCPVCAELVAAEACHLDEVVDGLVAPDFRRAYASSEGLCLPHLVLALERRGHGAGTAQLVDLTREKLRELAQDLRQFVDKHDHRVARPRFTDGEAGAWRRALALLSGRMELFGPEMARADGTQSVPRGRRSP